MSFLRRLTSYLQLKRLQVSRPATGVTCIRPIAWASDQSAGLNALSWRMMANSIALSMPGPIGEYRGTPTVGNA